MEIEAVKGAAYRAAAESLFLRAVQDGLPREAIEEISTLAGGEIPAWAIRWNVHAPCVLEQARFWDAEITIDGTRAPAIPDEWNAALGKMNDLPLGGLWLLGGIDDVLSDGSRREAMGELKKELKELKELKKALPSDDLQRQREWYLHEREPYLRDTLRMVREKHLLDPRNLAPIGADPLRETETRFLERARNHFRGRVLQAKSMGYVAVVPKPHLAEHMDWLVRFQINGESRANIAKTVNVVPQAVERAIRDLANTLRLALRPRSPSSSKPTK